MKKTLFGVLLFVFTICGSPAMAQDSQRISQLSSIDRTFMSNQRSRIDYLARMRLGRQLNSSRDNNLAILQALLDRRLVKSGQTLELQAMGVVLGDELARELSLRWVVVEDLSLIHI